MRLLEADIGKGEWVLKNSLWQRIKNLGIDSAAQEI